MSEVAGFGGLTKLDVPVDKVLDGAASATLEAVFVLGRDADGTLYAASSVADMGDVLIMIEEWKHELFSGGYK